MLRKTIGESMRFLRENKGLSRKEASMKAGFSPAFWGYLERGEKNPSLNIIENIAKALNVEPYRLFVESTQKGLPVEAIQLMQEIYSMGHEDMDFLITVMEAYIKVKD